MFATEVPCLYWRECAPNIWGRDSIFTKADAELRELAAWGFLIEEKAIVCAVSGGFEKDVCF